MATPMAADLRGRGVAELAWLPLRDLINLDEVGDAVSRRKLFVVVVDGKDGHRVGRGQITACWSASGTWPGS
jgi:hypothetical protein